VCVYTNICIPKKKTSIRHIYNISLSLSFSLSAYPTRASTLISAQQGRSRILEGRDQDTRTAGRYVYARAPDVNNRGEQIINWRL
jgi:hypothetical protein